MRTNLYNDILENFGHPILFHKSNKDPFLFQYDIVPVHKSKVHIKGFTVSESGWEELDVPAQRPDMNPIKHL